MVNVALKRWDTMDDKTKKVWLNDFRRLSGSETETDASSGKKMKKKVKMLATLKKMTDVKKVDITAIQNSDKKGCRNVAGPQYTIVDGKLRLSTRQPTFSFHLSDRGTIRVRAASATQS